jgi:hypothetical protein
MKRRSLVKTIVAALVGVWTLKPSTATPSIQQPLPLKPGPLTTDELLMEDMRRLYVEHIGFCARYGHKPVMRPPEELFAVAANLRTLHDLDAVRELYYAWTTQLHRCHALISAANGFDPEI